ncbi:hypothetical protein J6590_100957 [Homalodisca vitripennis]|nr:hypothetical protein J6590_100957 [Homalodisca vitripennis]
MMVTRIHSSKWLERVLDCRNTHYTSEGCISTYNNKEQKEEKKEKRVLTYPNAAWSPVQALSRQRKSRAQVTQET